MMVMFKFRGQGWSSHHSTGETNYVSVKLLHITFLQFVKYSTVHSFRYILLLTAPVAKIGCRESFDFRLRDEITPVHTEWQFRAYDHGEIQKLGC